MKWLLTIMLTLGCSVSSAQIEPDAGKWKTWVLTSGDQLRLPPPPDETATRAEIAQLKDIAKQRDAGTLETDNLVERRSARLPVDLHRNPSWSGECHPPLANHGALVGGDL